MSDQQKPKVAGIGEVLWDLLPAGKQLGGAPLNFAYHCQAAGCESYPISMVGHDDLGKEILESIRAMRLSTRFITVHSSLPTGTVTVDINHGLPSYHIHQEVAWDQLEWNESFESLASDLDAVCFGSLAQRSQPTRETIYRFLSGMKSDSLKVFDINLRQNFFSKQIISDSLDLCNVLKLNNEELDVLSELYSLNGSPIDKVSQLIDGYSLQMVALTLGEQGSILITPNERSEEYSPKLQLVDTIGAGDAFTGVLISEILKKTELKVMHRKAAAIASWVCTQPGATPPYIK